MDGRARLTPLGAVLLVLLAAGVLALLVGSALLQALGAIVVVVVILAIAMPALGAGRSGVMTTQRVLPDHDLEERERAGEAAAIARGNEDQTPVPKEEMDRVWAKEEELYKKRLSEPPESS